MDGAVSLEEFEAILSVLGSGRKHLYCVALTRDLASIKLADTRYQAASTEAQNREFQERIERFKHMEEWQYDALSDSARNDLEETLAQARRNQKEEAIRNLDATDKVKP